MMASGTVGWAESLWEGELRKRALVTGTTGQDGSYIAELLLEKVYEECGLIRRASTFNTARIDHRYQDPHDPDAKPETLTPELARLMVDADRAALG